MRGTTTNMASDEPNTPPVAEEVTEEVTCAVCLEKPEPPYSLPCEHTFCYLCLKQAAETGGMNCPLCRAIIPQYVLEEAKISDEVFVLEDKAGSWMYSGRTSGWWFYTPEIDSKLEVSWQAYQNGCVSSVNVVILGRTYTIDFATMEQRCLFNGTVRKIKRSEDVDEGEIVKGLAGLRVMPKEEMPATPDPVYPNPNMYTFNPNAWQDDEDYSDEEEYPDEEEEPGTPSDLDDSDSPPVAEDQ